jgi:hypothetical protein
MRDRHIYKNNLVSFVLNNFILFLLFVCSCQLILHQISSVIKKRFESQGMALSGRGLALLWQIVTMADDSSEPLCFASIEDADKYIRGIKDQYAKKSKRYYCKFHVDCRHFMKIVSPIPGSFHIYQCGDHTSIIKRTKYGVPCALRPLLDKYLEVGCGPLNAIAAVKEELRISPDLAPLEAALDEENKDKKKFQRKIQTRKTDLKHVARGRKH